MPKMPKGMTKAKLRKLEELNVSVAAAKISTNMKLMEVANAVGLSAARAVFERGGKDDEDIKIFRRIIANRMRQSARVGMEWQVVASGAYWAELCKLEGLRESSGTVSVLLP